MEYRIIKHPSKGTMNILLQRMKPETDMDISYCDAVGLIQGRLIDMVFAADIAEKAAGVVVGGIKGSCPQNMIMIAIFGDTASVETALLEVKIKIKNLKDGEA